MIKVGDKVLLKQGTILMGVPTYCDDIFKVDFIMDRRVKIVAINKIIWCSVDALIPLENQVLTLKKENSVTLDNGMGASVVVKTNDSKVINVTLLTKVDGPESPGKDYNFGKIESLNNFLSSLGFKNTFQFEKEETVAEVEETVAEVMEEMKNKALCYNYMITNWYIVIDYRNKKVYKNFNDGYDNVGTLYFGKKTAGDFAERLQAAYDREGWK